MLRSTDGGDRFVISTFTFSMVLMGWGGASGLPAVACVFLFLMCCALVLNTTNMTS